MNILSRFQIGDCVGLNVTGDPEPRPVTNAMVLGVSFTEGKVRYDLALPVGDDYHMTEFPVMSRVDSILVGPPNDGLPGFFIHNDSESDSESAGALPASDTCEGCEICDLETTPTSIAN